MAEMLLRLALCTKQSINLYIKNNEAHTPTSRSIYFLIYVFFVFVCIYWFPIRLDYMNSTTGVLYLVGSVVVFFFLFFSLFSSSVLCVQYSQCLWIVHS